MFFKIRSEQEWVQNATENRIHFFDSLLMKDEILALHVNLDLLHQDQLILNNPDIAILSCRVLFYNT